MKVLLTETQNLLLEELDKRLKRHLNFLNALHEAGEEIDPDGADENMHMEIMESEMWNLLLHDRFREIQE